MAGLTYSIGPFTFITLEGLPGVLAEKIELFALPFVAGETGRKQGRHSDPYVLRSFVDATNELAALDLVDAYTLLIGGANQTLVWRSVDCSTLTYRPFKVDVLEVNRSAIVKAVKIVGGLNVASGGSGVGVRADWVLRSVPA